MKHVYNYDRETGEFISETMAALDPLETKLHKRNIFLLPAHATFVSPPITTDGKIAVFNLKLKKWSIKTDLRGAFYFDTNGKESLITKIGKRVPTGHITERPSSDMKDPIWDGENWKESDIVFHGHKCDSKALLDHFVTREIAGMDEEKAKTLYLISLGKGGECPEWDAFLDARQTLLDEADAFISKNSLI
jgi:hypothetical protein